MLDLLDRIQILKMRPFRNGWYIVVSFMPA